MEEAIVKPPRRQRDKRPIPPWIIMAATGPDFQRLRRGLGLSQGGGEPLYLSRIYIEEADHPRYGLVGPFMGAPQAVMLMEALAAWGARQFLFAGWCGAIDPAVKIGDILLPTAAIIDEGTSRGYGMDADRVSLPSSDLHQTLKTRLIADGRKVHHGAVWSTDAIFRETPTKLQAFQNQGALAVEMEISACITVASLCQVGFTAILVVSDELTDLTWRPGFSHPRFKDSRQAMSLAIEELCQTL